MIWYFNCLAVSLGPLNLDSAQLVNKNSPTPDFLSIYFNLHSTYAIKRFVNAEKMKKPAFWRLTFPNPDHKVALAFKGVRVMKTLVVVVGFKRMGR